MNEMNISFSLENPEEKYKEIGISVENILEDNLNYKFLVGIDGTWTTLKKLSGARDAIWKPQADGKYSIMVQAKRKESKKPFDYMSKIDYLVGEAYEKLINDIYIDKIEIMAGEKVTLTVDATKIPIMYRYWVHERGNWLLIKDYSSENILTWTSKYCGEQEFLVECRNLDSKNTFDDSMKIRFNVQAIQSVEIVSFKCLTDGMVEGAELVFEVEANYGDNRMVLYKFVKINPKGNTKCIQDYSTKKLVSYVEENKGDYKLLCMAKDMYSIHEFDDRALIHYSVKPYEEINIHSFTSDLSSPQVCGTPIIFKCIARGGKELLYKFKIDGKCIEDSGYIRENNFFWIPKEAGEYKAYLWVKDASFKGEYEKKGSLDFLIDDIGNENVVIDDIILDNKETVLIGQIVHVKVKATGGNSLRYSFIISKDDKEIEKIQFGTRDFLEFTPEESGKFKLEVRVKDKYSKRKFDCHEVLCIQALECIPAKIDYVLMPTREYFMVGDTISLQVISENTKNTLVNYVLKIDGHLVEQTNFVEHKNYEIKPKCSGNYLIELLAKNKLSTNAYDSKKEIRIEIHETLPVRDTKILCDKANFMANETITFVAQSKGGKNVEYEVYLMEKGDWSLVQKFSRKNDYIFMPFTKGIYRILVLSKSSYKSISYEDYDIMEIEVKE
ncbi:triple tyrosine motif-containing protein [Clostridium sp. CF011]|uniref:triple tyrosine motif-containing protein n=1 Tax=Clostridium sp. CF011 TaxID=2843318 RepID=UPI001C0E6D17|nr:triple tyrosine motif-containing protein [Clostridium sp. CF011]MBU3091262.1 triple tyrosine motif-containing protein [Clostridium sp. CF011]WAG68571.1 triple tyrosine motif-containing protein [Clostridium sp. CF011]